MAKLTKTMVLNQISNVNASINFMSALIGDMESGKMPAELSGMDIEDVRLQLSESRDTLRLLRDKLIEFEEPPA